MKHTTRLSIFLTLIFAFAIIGSAQGFTEVFPGSLTGIYFGSVAWGDYDNDDDLDILLTGLDDNNTSISGSVKIELT